MLTNSIKSLILPYHHNISTAVTSKYLGQQNNHNLKLQQELNATRTINSISYVRYSLHTDHWRMLLYPQTVCIQFCLRVSVACPEMLGTRSTM